MLSIGDTFRPRVRGMHAIPIQHRDSPPAAFVVLELSLMISIIIVWSDSALCGGRPHAAAMRR